MKHIVLIPTLNEEDSITYVLDGIYAQEIIDEVIVCDNGSTDKTVEIATHVGATVTHESTRGYGHTLVKGIAYLERVYPSPHDVIVTFMDGDGADNPAELAYQAEQLNKYDIVLGSRTKLGTVRWGEWFHAFANRLFGMLLYCKCGRYYTDLGPFRSMTLATFLKLNIQDLTFGFTAEPQCTAVRLNLKTFEYFTDHRPRYGGESKVSGAPILKQIRIGIHIIRAIFSS